MTAITNLLVVFFISIFMADGHATTEKAAVSEAKKSEGKVFTLSVQPTTKPAIALERYKPIVDYLKEATKLNIELIVTDNYKDFSDLQTQGKVDFVIQDAFSAYLKDHRQNRGLGPLLDCFSF